MGKKKIQYRRLKDAQFIVIGKHGLVGTGVVLDEGEVPAAFLGGFQREEIEEVIEVSIPTPAPVITVSEVVESVEEVEVVEPWEGYSKETARDIIDILDEDTSVEFLEGVVAYETAHAARKTVLAAVAKLIAAAE